MTRNVWEKHKVVDPVTLRAIVTYDPQGQKPAERWPLVLLTDDRQIDPRGLLNEFGDHWGQEFAHRIGKHHLCLDILPPGYIRGADAMTRDNSSGRWSTTKLPSSCLPGCVAWCST
jgi:hypothetical protein